jgi:hypothetical protein
MEAMQPAFEDETPINPYDFWEGADFKIKIRKVEGWVNYDKSEFATPSALYEGDESRLETVYNQLHNLQDFLDPKNYKTYDELKAKLNRVLGVDAGMVETDPFEANAPTAEAPSMTEADTSFPPADDNNESEDDTLSYFAKLAKES